MRSCSNCRPPATAEPAVRAPAMGEQGRIVPAPRASYGEPACDHDLTVFRS
ncbi:hypothetical protein [Lysobacter gummosus]|uniref:hypothetical protein n=1 Tax=Lysobacter gummosus TaxID=262324 RepID=UPI00364520BC